MGAALAATGSVPASLPLVAAGAARVVDGDTLDLHGTRVRLFGIDAPEHDQHCARADGRGWACGAAAKQALERLVRGAEVRCEGSARDRYGRRLARCFAGGADIGAALVSGGMAWAYRRYALDYTAQEAAARAVGRGVWQGAAVRPEAARAQMRLAARTGGETGCAIKGNISAGGRIYHLPGQADYAATRIAVAQRERWFCSEAEARAAGWRRAKR